MKSLSNSVRLIGNVGKIFEIDKTSDGNSFLRISLATVDEFINQKGEQVKEIQWHNIVAWNKTAEIAEKYLSIGTKIAIEGKLTSYNFSDKEEKKNRITVITLNEIMFLNKNA